MISSNLSDFNDNINEYLDRVEGFNEMLILKRKSTKGSVLMSLTEYNSLMRTLHQLQAEKNQSRINESKGKKKIGNVMDKPSLN